MNDARILAEELRADDVKQRRRAAKMLALLEEAAQPAALELLIALSDRDDQVRQWSTEALDMLGAPDISETTAIANLAVSIPDSDVQYYAITLLGRLGTTAVEYVSDLLTCTEKQFEATVRVRAIWALSRISNKSVEAKIIEALEQLKNDENANVSEAAIRSLTVLQR